MARRIDIELTSARPDGTWTWRAAGALKPRGVLDGSLLYEGAKAGDVVRADADFELEGIVVVAVLAPKEKKRNEPERLEVVGPPREPTPGVTASLTSRPEQRRDRPEGGPRGPRRADGGSGRGAGDQGGHSRERRPAGPPAGGAERPGRDRPARERPARPPREESREGQARGPESSPRPARSRPAERSGADRPPRAPEPDTPARPKARRLNPGNVHRTAVLESLPPEERPIAEQVLRGGIPAVRTALHLEREKATAEGRQAPNSEALLGIAEQLLPRLKAAEWQDRAEAAARIADELSIRDLRSVVAGADVARDDESRELAVQLREALERRLNAQRQEWLDDVIANLADGRVVRALRVSARPPDPGSRFPAELAARLAEVASSAMAPDTPAERWAALLEAVAASPVRRSVKPVGLPSEPGEALLHAARQSSGRIPALAVMLGISIPPPPGPVRSGGRPARPAARPVPPPPPAPSAGGVRAPDAATSAPGEPEPAEPAVAEPPAAPPADTASSEPAAGSGPADESAAAVEAALPVGTPLPAESGPVIETASAVESAPTAPAAAVPAEQSAAVPAEAVRAEAAQSEAAQSEAAQSEAGPDTDPGDGDVPADTAGESSVPTGSPSAP